MSKNFDGRVRLQSEKRKEWIREMSGERLQGIAKGNSSAPRLASLSAASFPGRNECLRTHCSLIEQEKREDNSCQICRRASNKREDRGKNRVARTERELERRRRGEKWQTCWCCRDQQRSCRTAQAYWVCGKEKSGLKATKRKVGKNAGAALPKGTGTEPSVQNTRS